MCTMASTWSEGLENGQARPDTVSDIFGLKVYTKSGVYVGTVDDVKVDFNQRKATGIALTDVNRELKKAANDSSNGVVIPYTWIDSVHDVVLTIDIIERLDYTE